MVHRLRFVWQDSDKLGHLHIRGCLIMQSGGHDDSEQFHHADARVVSSRCASGRSLVFIFGTGHAVDWQVVLIFVFFFGVISHVVFQPIYLISITHVLIRVVGKRILDWMKITLTAPGNLIFEWNLNFRSRSRRGIFDALHLFLRKIIQYVRFGPIRAQQIHSCPDSTWHSNHSFSVFIKCTYLCLQNTRGKKIIHVNKKIYISALYSK